MYHFGMSGSIIWTSHIFMGSFFSYLGYLTLNKKDIGQINSLILIVIGVLGALYHLHLWYYNFKLYYCNNKNDKIKHNHSKHDHSKHNHSKHDHSKHNHSKHHNFKNNNINNSSIATLEGKKYDLSKFINSHPGGQIIRKAYGKDLKKVWKRYGVSWHLNNNRVKNVLNNIEVK